MQEVGPVWFVYSTTLLEPAKGETDDLGVRHQASCPDLLHTVPDPYLAWGRGKMGNGERVEEDWGLLGNPSHPWSGVYGAVLGQTGAAYPDKNIIPHVRERFCQSTSSPIAFWGASSA